jgi:hypothetical protein
MGKNSPKDSKKPYEMVKHVYYSSFATLLAHPARVFLNRASLYQWPLQTIIASYPYLLKGLSYNLVRGTLATGSQSAAKHVVQERMGLLSGMVAASLCGTAVATWVETPFLRKTLLQEVQGTSLWRVNKTLSSLYFLREAGFSFAVLAKNDLSPSAQYAALFGGAWVTAVAHKFAALEAIRDTLPREITAPDFRHGVVTTIRNMAMGDIYSHSVFQVPFKNPKHLLAMISNLMHVSCGANMYLFRLLYLVTFREAYFLASQTEPNLISHSAVFFRKTLVFTPQKVENDAYSPPDCI